MLPNNITLNQLRNKIIQQCQKKGYCYLNRAESNLVLSVFNKLNIKYDKDLPKTKNNRLYKWHKLMLETRSGNWFVNFTLNAIRSETFEEFYSTRPNPSYILD